MENSSRLYISSRTGGREERKEQLMAYGVWKSLYTSAEIEWTAYTQSLEAYEQLMCPCIRFLSVDMSQEDQVINAV